MQSISFKNIKSVKLASYWLLHVYSHGYRKWHYVLLMQPGEWKQLWETSSGCLSLSRGKRFKTLACCIDF